MAHGDQSADSACDAPNRRCALPSAAGHEKNDGMIASSLAEAGADQPPLLEAGERGLELLRRHVLLELDVQDIHDQPVRAVHPAWANVLELLLPAADDQWREEVEAYDPCLVARVTGSKATGDQRARAVEVLWSTYLDRRVWLERRASVGNGSSDGDALVRLVAIEVPPGFDDTLRAATTAEERTVRGNAMELVPHVLPADEALEMLTRAVRDEDAVVRRRAAAAGWAMAALHPDLLSDNLLMATYVDAMADQAVHVDTDEMAAETLIGVAIDLAPESRAVEIAMAPTGKLHRRAMTCLARRVNRSRLLEMIRSAQTVDDELLSELLEDRRLGRREPWSSSDVAALARLVAQRHDETYWHHDATDVLAEQPVVAMLALLEYPVADEIRYGLGNRLIMAMDEPQIDGLLSYGHRILRSLETMPSRPTRRLGTRPLSRSSAELLAGTLEARRNPSVIGPVVGAKRRRADAAREPERELTDDEVRGVFDNGGVAAAFNPQTQSVSRAMLRALTADAERNVALDANLAAQLLMFLLDWHDPELEVWQPARRPGPAGNRRQPCQGRAGQ